MKNTITGYNVINKAVWLQFCPPYYASVKQIKLIVMKTHGYWYFTFFFSLVIQPSMCKYQCTSKLEMVIQKAEIFSNMVIG